MSLHLAFYTRHTFFASRRNQKDIVKPICRRIHFVKIPLYETKQRLCEIDHFVLKLALLYGVTLIAWFPRVLYNQFINQVININCARRDNIDVTDMTLSSFCLVIVTTTSSGRKFDIIILQRKSLH